MSIGASPTVCSLAAALLDPATYTRSPFHDTAIPIEPIELCETHISWVALSGQFAYKVKKPVRFDFLDYGTLERRHAACLIELELNRRWAPELYLGLSRLVRSPAGLFFDVEGEVIEYSVRMRRFPRENELDRLLPRRAVDAAELGRFGAFIAAQHGQAPRAPADAGNPAVLDRAVLQNFDTLELARPSAALSFLKGWTGQVWPGIEARLWHRRLVGRVRECHGDLHCGNVVRIGDRLLPYDGIDFDPGLRFIDVASDIAFIVMDLEARGRSDLAMACLNAWLEHSGDYEAGACLRFLLVYRALVRAKIAALRARQVPARAADTGATESINYVDHAYRCATRKPGGLVLMHGYSASGKSTVAESLVPALPAIRVRADVVRKQLGPATADVPLASRLNEGRYSPANTSRTYKHLASAAEALLQAGFNVVADATFLDPTRRDSFTALGRMVGAPVVIVSCDAPPDVLRARILNRAEDVSEATLAVLEQQLAAGRELDAECAPPIVSVRTDTELRVTEVCAAIGAALNRARVKAERG